MRCLIKLWGSRLVILCAIIGIHLKDAVDSPGVFYVPKSNSAYSPQSSQNLLNHKLCVKSGRLFPE